jgi:hypothetical protein
LWESGKERREKIADLATRTEAAVRLNGGNAAASSVSDDKARAVLAKELSKKEYTPSLKDDLWLRAGKWIQDMLEAIFSHLPSGSWTAVAYVLAAIAIILFAIVLVFLAKMIVEHYGSRAPREMPVYRHIERTSTRPSIESLLQAADEAASGSRYREALRHIYLATLLTLDRAQLISYVEGTTNWEYMRALRRQGASQSAVFGDMTLLFDEAVYGHRDLSQQDYTSTRERLRELEATL